MSEIITPGVALPQGSVDFTGIMTDIISPSHINRPGRNTTLAQRNPNFYGCGSVCVAGIKHNNANAKDDSHVPVPFVLLPVGFATQARAARESRGGGTLHRLHVGGAHCRVGEALRPGRLFREWW